MSHKPPRPESQSRYPPLTSEERIQMKQWLDNWARVGPILEEERWTRVRALTDADAARDAMRLWDLWQPDWPTDEGEELLLHQRVFAPRRR